MENFINIIKNIIIFGIIIWYIYSIYVRIKKKQSNDSKKNNLDEEKKDFLKYPFDKELSDFFKSEKNKDDNKKSFSYLKEKNIVNKSNKENKFNNVKNLKKKKYVKINNKILFSKKAMKKVIVLIEILKLPKSLKE